MSTTQAPNPREFKTWEDAFQYPVPVVRRLEQQIRSNINENRDKLRSLVGSSYRDLLGTAERIVEMDGQMHTVESGLAEIGQKCNARAVERIAANHQRNAKAQTNRSLGRNAIASNVSLLQSCMTQAARIIKRRESALLAAKLLVLARLLYTSAAKSPDPPTLLDSLRSKLASLRRKLLSHVDRRLALVGTDKSLLIDTLAAFSLATTSTPTDVLNHFLHIRATALGDFVDAPSQDDVDTAMSLLIATLKDAQAVFPKQLSSLLGRLQDEPILQDSDIRSMAELNLDIYERWVADDVRNFTPWLRHDQLQASAASNVLKKWVVKARATLFDGLRTLLDTMHDASAIMALRKDLLSRSLSADRRLPGLDTASFFEELRSCFVARLREVAVESTGHLPAIVTHFLDDGLANDQSAVSLWDPENTEIDLGKGAINFRNLIHNANQGKGSRLQALEQSLTEWSAKVATLSNTIKAMRDDRWNDDLDLDIEDDFEIDSPQDLLSKEDPKELQKLLASEKEKSLSAVYEKVQSTAASTGGKDKAMLLLRLLRDVVHQASSSEGTASTSRPSSSLYESLHKMLVEKVAQKSFSRRKTGPKTPALFTRSPPTALWEGTPPLPAQPSPACFRYLHETCKSMKDVGSDLWTPSAVAALKIQLRKTVAESLSNLSSNKSQVNGRIDAQDNSINGDKDATADETSVVTEGLESSVDGVEQKTHTASEDLHNARAIQAVFDLLYLDKMLILPADQTAAQNIDEPIKRTASEAALEDAALERLRKNSVDYYKRTYLLFGLLAVG